MLNKQRDFFFLLQFLLGLVPSLVCVGIDYRGEGRGGGDTGQSSSYWHLAFCWYWPAKPLYLILSCYLIFAVSWHKQLKGQCQEQTMWRFTVSFDKQRTAKLLTYLSYPQSFLILASFSMYNWFANMLHFSTHRYAPFLNASLIVSMQQIRISCFRRTSAWVFGALKPGATAYWA